MEKIRQKLVLEGLEPELINPVLESVSTPKCFSAAEDEGPPLERAPCRQISARKFHDMLSQGLPAASVRQKMAMEGCRPEDINSFFAQKTGKEKTSQEA